MFGTKHNIPTAHEIEGSHDVDNHRELEHTGTVIGPPPEPRLPARDIVGYGLLDQTVSSLG